jgi:hypothetical protein
MTELNDTVSTVGNMRADCERRRVPYEKGDQRTERAQDSGGDCETHENRQYGLAQTDIDAQQWREHGVEESITDGCQQDDEREFDGDEERLARIAPPAHRRAV